MILFVLSAWRKYGCIILKNLFQEKMWITISNGDILIPILTRFVQPYSTFDNVTWGKQKGHLTVNDELMIKWYYLSIQCQWTRDKTVNWMTFSFSKANTHTQTHLTYMPCSLIEACEGFKAGLCKYSIINSLDGCCTLMSSDYRDG